MTRRRGERQKMWRREGGGADEQRMRRRTRKIKGKFRHIQRQSGTREPGTAAIH